MNKSVTIIGGGVIGCAIAYELSKTAKEIFVVERNPRITGDNQSSRNSGVIHSGIYYNFREVPLKAKLCVEGNRKMYEFCEKFDVPHRKTGKVVVAVDENDEEYLENLLVNAQENNIPDVKMIKGRVAMKIEPNIIAKSAFYVPTTGIIEPTRLVRTLEILARNQRVHFVMGNKVTGINDSKKGFDVTTASGGKTETFRTGIIINAAGLYSDEIAKMVDPDNHHEIMPVRGESAKFDCGKRNDLRINGRNIYPAPYPFYNDTGERAMVSYAEAESLIAEGKATRTVGVHLTPTLDINEEKTCIGRIVTVGPAQKTGLGKEDLSTGLYPEEHYLKLVQPFFPNLRLEDISLNQAGIQAKLKGHSDFLIEWDKKHKDCLHLIGIDSPGLTSSLAIAEYVAAMMMNKES